MYKCYDNIQDYENIINGLHRVNDQLCFVQNFQDDVVWFYL